MAMTSDCGNLIKISVSGAQIFAFLRTLQVILIHSQGQEPQGSPDGKCAVVINNI